MCNVPYIEPLVILFYLILFTSIADIGNLRSRVYVLPIFRFFLLFIFLIFLDMNFIIYVRRFTYFRIAFIKSLF